MNIVQRNFFRLIRCGAFNKQEQIEPMSACKWNKLHQLAVMHNVVESVYHGLELTKDQFFVHLTDKQWEQWSKTIDELHQQPQKEEDDDEFLRADHLTNPVLNSKLQSILELHYICGKSWEDIAAELGCTTSNVFKMHARALQEIEVPDFTENFQ